MAKETTDRRIPRTRAMLQHALTTLTLRKGYEAITIKNICDEANVGRSTFYAHYTSKEDLKRSGLDHLRYELVKQQQHVRSKEGDAGNRSLGFSLAMFEHARDHSARSRAPRQPPSPSPAMTAKPTVRVSVKLDKTWGQRHCTRQRSRILECALAL